MTKVSQFTVLKDQILQGIFRVMVEIYIVEILFKKFQNIKRRRREGVKNDRIAKYLLENFHLYPLPARLVVHESSKAETQEKQGKKRTDLQKMS